MPTWDAVWRNAHLATLREGTSAWGEIEEGALAVEGGRIAWLGAEAALPDPLPGEPAVHDAGGAWITPGLVDCHTHAIFGGNRARDFQRRLEGASYEQIAREGGGIRRTVEATCEAGDEELLELARGRLRSMGRDGVTTVEVKSGYGLEVEDELRLVRLIRRLAGEVPLAVHSTLLAAHALPPRWRDRREAYERAVREEMIPRAAADGLADAVDVFCEGIAFTTAECERILRTALDHDLPVRIHADQLSDRGGAALAASLGARSADHLEYTSMEGVSAMARAGTVAVLLPGAAYFLREKRRPPVALLREFGVPMAVATDLNPGTSPLTSLPLALNLACVVFGLTPLEALLGATRNAALALGMRDERGTLEVGKRADLALWDVERPEEIVYWIGSPPCRGTVRDGRPVVWDA